MKQVKPKEHLYPVTYQVNRLHKKPVAAAKIRESGLGACDVLIIHSIMMPEDGSRSEAILSYDGRTGNEVDDMELFKSWMMTAHRLEQSTTLPDGHRELAKTTFEIYRMAILREREATDRKKKKK